ncbi:hypothetical protein PRK78_006751 [Emydomyces testavorans]|uniref:Uncharacterized protein n=1 Tax=Emydomyces testavorans TaxID=2070801 RepID=A0AAF0DLY4_9EURO|nr:hypothetical protein PRK78_006751 [Emydomyces testavorans]
MKNKFCDPNGAPVTLQELNPALDYCFFPGVTNSSDPRLAECCGENPTGVVDNCYGWCQIPDQLLKPKGKYGSKDEVLVQFGQCVRQAARSHNMTESLVGCSLPHAKKSGAGRLSTDIHGGTVSFIVLWESSGLSCGMRGDYAGLAASKHDGDCRLAG